MIGQLQAATRQKGREALLSFPLTQLTRAGPR